MDERLKILEMLKNGNITVSEADSLLQTIEDIEDKKESKNKEKFNKFSDSLKSSLSKFGDEVKKINSEGIKESLKKGYDEVNALIQAGKVLGTAVITFLNWSPSASIESIFGVVSLK